MTESAMHPLLQHYLPHSVFRTRAVNAVMLPSLLSVAIPLGFRHDSFWANVYYMTLTDSFCFRICNTQWEVLLSKQVNYNQVVVKCQIYKNAFFIILICKNFTILNIQIQGLFRDFQVLSRTYSVFKDFQGPGIFFSSFFLKDFSRTL